MERLNLFFFTYHFRVFAFLPQVIPKLRRPREGPSFLISEIASVYKGLGGRDRDRTGDLLVANGESLKLRRVATIS
jgi:hypothetical protein